MLKGRHAPDMAPPRERPLDYEGIADFLQALAYPVRLELLHQLRFPHVLSELKVSARRSGPDERPDRPASRPAVLGHLEKLESADLVRTDSIEQGGRAVKRYQVNSLKLYEVTEELRRLSIIHAGRGPAGEATGTLDQAPGAAQPSGPRLVLVYGLYEGKSFSLAPAARPDGQWLIGRRKGLAISLDYDPYVSGEHALVTWEDGRYVVHDLPTSKNGTLVNWVPLPKRGSHVLRPADVIGVGRSLLSFAPA